MTVKKWQDCEKEIEKYDFAETLTFHFWLPDGSFNSIL